MKVCFTLRNPSNISVLIILMVEVLEIISAGQRCFRGLKVFSADSANMKNISDDFLSCEIFGFEG